MIQMINRANIIKIKIVVRVETNSSFINSLFSLHDGQSLYLLLKLVLALDGLRGGLRSLATLPHEDEDYDAREKDKSAQRPSDRESDLERGHVARVGLGIRQFLLHDVFIKNIKLVGSIEEVGAVVFSWLLEVLLHVGQVLAKNILELLVLVPFLLLWSTGGVQAGGEDPGGHQEDQDPGFHHGWWLVVVGNVQSEIQVGRESTSLRG